MGNKNKTEKTAKSSKADHLKKYQFKKGESGNPKGRPKEVKSIPDILRRLTGEPLEEDPNTTKLESIMNRVVNKALKGNKWAIEFIANRTEGKPKETIQQLEVNQIQEIKMI